jgi:hypothetical protein
VKARWHWHIVAFKKHQKKPSTVATVLSGKVHVVRVWQSPASARTEVDKLF